MTSAAGSTVATVTVQVTWQWATKAAHWHHIQQVQVAIGRGGRCKVISGIAASYGRPGPGQLGTESDSESRTLRPGQTKSRSQLSWPSVVGRR